MEEDRALDVLRENGYKRTPQRRAVIRALVDREKHPSVDSVYQQVKKEMPDISLTTVYKAMAELASLGLIKSLDARNGRVHYDTNVSIHGHLVCLNCGRIEDVFRDRWGVELIPEETKGFKILAQEIYYYGLCPQCQKVDKTEE